MTNYNDGKWHGWNGGDCPVHGKTMVEVIWFSAGHTVQSSVTEASKRLTWRCGYAGIPPVAFRVVKEYKQPREYWVNYEKRSILTIRGNDDNETFVNRGYIHMREVD